MLIKPHLILRAPADAAAPAGGNAGVGTPPSPALSPLHALAQMLAEDPSPGVTATQDAPTSPEIGEPQEPAAGAAEDGGQQNLTPETPTAEGESPEGDSPNPPSESDTEAEKPKPEVTKATQKRIDELTAEKYRLRDENEALKLKLQERETPPDRETPDSRLQTPDSLPASVAKLRTVADVEARQAQLETLVDGLQDFLDSNPGSPDTVYDAQTQQPVNGEADGKRYLTRAQIVAERAQWRAELKALPKRASQITQTEQLTRTQSQIQAKLVEKYPHLNDPENAETKMFQAALKAYASHPGGPLIAYKLARGHAIVEAELNGNTNGNGHGKTPFGSAAGHRPALPGKVPLGKPSAPAGVAAPRPAPQAAKVAAAIDRNRKEGSRESLAELIAAGGL